MGSLVRVPECSITLLPHGVLSFLPGLLERKQAASPSPTLSASYHWPEISYWGTCIQLYKPTTSVWQLTAHHGLLRYHPSSCSFCFVCICGLIKVALPFPMNSFSCLYPLRSSGSGQPVSFSSTHWCLGVEEVSCCSDEMCLQLHLFFSWVLQQIPGLQRWSFDKKSKIILSTIFDIFEFVIVPGFILWRREEQKGG